MDKNYGGVIWTNHALERLSQRGISQSDAWATWRRPDQSRWASAKGAWIYYKTYKTDRLGGGSTGEKIEVVAKNLPAQAGNGGKQWLIISVWSKPVYASKTAISSKLGDRKSILDHIKYILSGK